MAQTSIEYTEYGQQYITLPLVIKNTMGGVIIVSKVYVQNIFLPESAVSQDDLVLTINESNSDYSEVEQNSTTDYKVVHINGFNGDSDKNFKVERVISLGISTSFTFQVVFNPNINRNIINRGNFVGKVVVEYSIYGITQPNFELNLEASCSDKSITLFSGVPYGSVSNVFGIAVNNVRNLN